MGWLDALTSLFSGGGGGLSDVASSAADSGAFQFADDAAREGVNVAPVTAPTVQTPGVWGGIKDVASSVAGGAKEGLGALGSVAKTALPVAQLGLTGMGIASQMQGAKQLASQTKLAEAAAKRNADLSREMQSVAAPVQKFSAEQLALASTGKLPDYLEAQLEELRRAEKQKLNDYFARSGQGDSTSIQSALAQVDNRILAIKGQLIQGMQSGAINSAAQAAQILSGASGATSQSGREAAGQQQSMQQLMAQAAAEMAKLSAS